MITLPPIENSLKLNAVPASVKNIDLSKDFGISLVSGTNLLYLLSNENPRYLRRVYNILADHSGSIIGERGPANELGARASLHALRKEAWLSIKYLSAYKALSGDTFRRQAASLFIVNDSSGKHTYVLEISDIMNLIYRSVWKDLSAIEDIFHFEVSSMVPLVNTWSSTVEDRMARVIDDIHGRKISVAFKNSAFNNIVNKVGIKA